MEGLLTFVLYVWCILIQCLLQILLFNALLLCLMSQVIRNMLIDKFQLK